jgi:hypothetical protein
MLPVTQNSVNEGIGDLLKAPAEITGFKYLMYGIHG